MIEQMRTDFPLAALAEGWDHEDQEDIGLQIKTAIDAGDAEAIAYWAKRLGEAATAWREWTARVRAVEERIHHEADLARKKAA